MNAREELAGTLRTHVCEEGIDLINEGPDWHIHDAAQYAQEVASVVIAAGYRKPRTITTAEELDALPNGSVVKADLTSHHSGGWNLAYQRWEDGSWHRGARAASTHPDYIVPATVLWEPQP